MKHVFITDRLQAALLMKWHDAKMSNLEIYIANVTPIQDKNVGTCTAASYHPDSLDSNLL